MQNFTVADLMQTTFATFAFALFLLPSGYLLGLASNVFGIRSRSAAEKTLFSVTLSIAATPILAVLLTRFFSYKITLAVFLLLAVTALSTLLEQLPRWREFFSGLHRSTWLLLCMMLAWFLVVQLSLADLQIGHRLYVSFIAFDHSVRVPFVEAAARNGVPPLNPFYGVGKVPVLRYFYYWYVVCALPMQLFGIGARGCLNASVFWSGLGLASTIPLFLKYFLGQTESLRRKSVIGIALLTVTGLDLIPYAAIAFHDHVLSPDMEWWDPNQITSWVGSLLWVPHHVASLTACMAGLLVFSTIDEDNPLRQRIWAAVISGVAFASAAGLSVYVTFSFAVFAILWTLMVLRQKRIKTVATYLATAAFTLVLSWPYLQDLLSKHIDTGLNSDPGERFAYFAIRDFPVALHLLGKLGMHDSILLELSKLPVLLIVYIFEFGFFALVMLRCFRWGMGRGAPLSRQHRMMWMMLVVCLLTMSVVKSDSSGVNDLGIRGMLVVQFALLILSAPFVYDVFFRNDAAAQKDLHARWIKSSLVFTLVLGVAGTAYQLVALRCYAPLADAGKLTRSERFLGTPGFGERTYWLREGFSRLSKLTPSTALVQYNPVRDEALTAHLYSARQAVMGDAFCASAFGGDVQNCRKAFPRIASAFNSPDKARKLNLNAFCDEFQVNVLVATDADPVWQDKDSWVWTRPSLLATPLVRATACGSATHSMAAK
jgi:hypothetical protein